MKKTLNVGGKILELTSPLIMGIVNLTPDSFYSKSRALGNYKKKVESMVLEGADILDLGAYSTRPGAAEVSIQEEIDRLIPALEFIRDNAISVTVSIDTFRAEVAEKCLALHPSILNDVSGGNYGEEMWFLAQSYKVPYILMHMRGNPQTMMDLCHYPQGVSFEVLQELQAKLKRLNEIGVKDVIIDPGFGFAKNVEQNFELLKDFEALQLLDRPILGGVSRKSFIWKTLNLNPDTVLPASLAIQTYLLLQKAAILRVHDVKEAVQCRNILYSSGLL